MAHSRLKNNFTIEEAIGRVAIAVAAHPFDYVKILVQLGYEPLPAFTTRTIFRTTRLAYPGVFTYLGYIRRQDGFQGMFRGLTYKVLYTLINGYVHVNLTEVVKQIEEEKAAKNADGAGNESDEGAVAAGRYFTVERIRKLMDKLLRETLCNFVSLTVSYPFQLMVIRSCAQFVGREAIYDGIGGAVSDIYANGGVAGFYAGFMPKFYGNVLILWTSHGLIFLVKGFIEGESTVQGYLAASINFVVASLMYPFTVVSTVMAVNGSGAASLEAARLSPDFMDWGDCWRHLSQLGQIKRGSSLFWRYQPHLEPSRIKYGKNQ